MCYFPCIILYFYCYLSIDPSVGRHLCFERDKKRYRGTKNDITGQKTISRDISFLYHRVIARIKAQVCDKYRLSYEKRGDISFIALVTISYFVTSERSERGTKYDIVPRAIKLISPRLSYDNLYIYPALSLVEKSDMDLIKILSVVHTRFAATKPY